MEVLTCKNVPEVCSARSPGLGAPLRNLKLRVARKREGRDGHGLRAAAGSEAAPTGSPNPGRVENQHHSRFQVSSGTPTHPKPLPRPHRLRAAARAVAPPISFERRCVRLSADACALGAAGCVRRTPAHPKACAKEVSTSDPDTTAVPRRSSGRSAIAARAGLRAVGGARGALRPG